MKRSKCGSQGRTACSCFGWWRACARAALVMKGRDWHQWPPPPSCLVCLQILASTHASSLPRYLCTTVDSIWKSISIHLQPFIRICSYSWNATMWKSVNFPPLAILFSRCLSSCTFLHIAHLVWQFANGTRWGSYLQTQVIMKHCQIQPTPEIYLSLPRLPTHHVIVHPSKESSSNYFYMKWVFPIWVSS